MILDYLFNICASLLLFPRAGPNSTKAVRGRPAALIFLFLHLSSFITVIYWKTQTVIILLGHICTN